MFVGRLSRLAISLLCLLPCLALANTEQTFGRAYKPGTQKLLYTERYVAISGDMVKVVYENPQGEIIAEKLLDFSKAAFAPDLRSEDYRRGTGLVIENSAERLTITQGEANKKAVSATLAKPENLVIDAGFDNFVREHWVALLAGERRVIQFLVPARNRSVKLQVSQRDCPAFSSDTSEPRQCFRIKAVNWLIAVALKTINLEYSSNSRRLLRFTGLGQLRDSSGKNQRIDLHYDLVGLEDTANDYENKL